jgi:tetratricopeptide (TPR) repeat protein
LSAAATKECPFCAETVKAAAVVCRFCGRDLPPARTNTAPAQPRSAGPARELFDSRTSLHQSEIFDLLTALIEKSLVVYEEDEQGRGRYRLLETVRQYARERLLESAEGGALRSCHLEYFMALAEQADAGFEGPDLVLWLDRLERELDNLRAALEWGRSEPDPRERWVRLQSALVEFWIMRDHIQEGRDWMEQAGQAESCPMALQARLLGALAYMRLFAGDGSRSGEPMKESLRVFRELQDQRGISRLLLQFAYGARQDRKEEARALGREGLEISRQTGDDYGAAWHLLNLGTTDYGTAPGVGLLEESVVVARRTGNPWVQAWATRDLGHALFQQGDAERGRAMVAESRRLFQQVGCRWAISWSLESLGNAASSGGDFATARALYEESLSLKRELKDRVGEARALLIVGRAARDQGDYPAAHGCFTGARQIAEELDHRPLLVAALHSLGEIARLEQEHEEAGPLLDESLAIAREADDRRGILASLHEQAMLAQDQGKWERAAAYWVDLLTRAREWERQQVSPDAAWISGPNPPPELLSALEGIGRVWLQQGEARRAVRLLGAVTAARDARPLDLWRYRPSDHAAAESIVPAVQAALGPEGFEEAWSEGRSMPLAQAVAAALEEDEDGGAGPS